jgi:hypothetical protein
VSTDQQTDANRSQREWIITALPHGQGADNTKESAHASWTIINKMVVLKILFNWF